MRKSERSLEDWAYTTSISLWMEEWMPKDLPTILQGPYHIRPKFSTQTCQKSRSQHRDGKLCVCVRGFREKSLRRTCLILDQRLPIFGCRGDNCLSRIVWLHIWGESRDRNQRYKCGTFRLPCLYDLTWDLNPKYIWPSYKWFIMDGGLETVFGFNELDIIVKLLSL